MRITIPVSGDGDAWMAHLPDIDFDAAKMIGDDGKLVISEVVALFKRANEFCELHGYRPTFMTSADDGHNVYSMTVEFLRQLAAVTNWIESRHENAHASSDESAQDRRLERRMERRHVAFVRIDVANVAGGVRFVVGSSNPMSKVVGNCEGGASECVIYLTRILLKMAEGVNDLCRAKNAGLCVTVVGRDPDLVPEARHREEIGRERDRVREANELRKTCVRRLGAYCSPSDPNCRCHRAGRCVELELPKA